MALAKLELLLSWNWWRVSWWLPGPSSSLTVPTTSHLPACSVGSYVTVGAMSAILPETRLEDFSSEHCLLAPPAWVAAVAP